MTGKVIITLANGNTITWDSNDQPDEMERFVARWQAWQNGDIRTVGADLNFATGERIPIDYRDIVRVDIGEPR